MAKAQPIKILIVGGSVTYGADLPNRMQQRWSTYFTQIFNSGWYSGHFDIVNIGVGACNVDVWIDRVNEMANADLVIVDLSVNDQGFELQALPHLYHTFIQLIDNLPNHPALLFHQAFRTANRDTRELGHCPAKNSQGTCCNGFLFCKRWWDMQDFVAIPLTRLGVPFVSYRDLIWPDYDNPSPDLDKWWNGLSHPDARAHKMIAKLLAFGVMMQVKEAHLATHCELGDEHGRYVSSTEIDQTVMPICRAPLTSLRAGQSPESVKDFPMDRTTGAQMSASNPLPVPSPWRYYNDSQLKFGWITEMSADEISQRCGNGEKWCTTVIEQSTISFKLQFSAAPRLQISFLKSYAASMGAIAAWIDDKKDETVYIDGHWDLPYSVAHTMTFSKEPLVNISTIVVGDSGLFPSLSEGTHMLHLSLPPKSNKKPYFKWKLLAVTSC